MNLEDVVRPTTLIEAPRLARRLGTDVFLASETFQRTGSFKFRAAWNVASKVPQTRLLTASSGNFGQALAAACQLLGKTCRVVMPHTSARVKIDAVREWGGEVDLIDVQRVSRQDRLQELASRDTAAYVASPYDDPLVIEGNASLGRELATVDRRFDVVVAPVGGGGLLSGLVQGLREAGYAGRIFGAEPALGNDAAQSLRLGRIVVNATEPQTIADGARTVSLGRHNWSVLQGAVGEIVEVSEDQIRESVRALFLLANLKVEPTGAMSLAALPARQDLFHGASVCCVISGGNVDPEQFSELVRVPLSPNYGVTI